jgi:hypothetical protein
MSLNLFQRRAIAIGLLINVLIGLFPPWIISVGGGESRVQFNAGFAFLFQPPGMFDMVKKRIDGPVPVTGAYQDGARGAIAFFPGGRGAPVAEINLRLLFVEWILVGFIVAAIVIWFGKKSS